MLRHSLLLVGLVLVGFPLGNQRLQASEVIPLPQRKPSHDISLGGSSALKPETKEHLAPLPVLKPVGIVPNNKKMVATPEGGVRIVDDKANKVSNILFSDRQDRLTREIFDLQNQGRIKEADQKISQLNNKIILGHILAERYLHPTAYNSSSAELLEWLKHYEDLPQAKKIYELALIKSSNPKTLKEPKNKKVISGNLNALTQAGKTYTSTKKRSEDQNARVKKLNSEIDYNIRKQQPTLALNILNNDYAVQFIDDVEYDRLRAVVASGYLHAEKIDDALSLSQLSLDRSGALTPMAGWVNGLAHWQKGNYTQAAQSFEVTASSPYASGWMVSAAAYWASRAHMHTGNAMMVSKWLGIAATYPRTFYGLVATRALGHDSRFNWDVPSLSREYANLIEKTERGKRAAALIAAEKTELAEEELKYFNFGKSQEKKQALLSYANYYKLPSLLMRLGNAVPNPIGGLYDAALYPVADFEPKSGYNIDKALVYAFIRQESRFNQLASNASGATGLMQLMPATAVHISGQNVYEESSGQYQLKRPEINLELGQKYIQELLDNESVNNDLMLLAIAYNAGPGNLSKWKAERGHITDPLLFIESIPFPETRAFVERVLSNYWIYRMRMNESTPSLDAVASGKWAHYTGKNDSSSRLASR